MKTKMILSSAIAVVAGFAPAAHALTTFATYTADPNAVANMSWTRTGFSAGTLANVPGDSDLEAGVTDVSFSLLVLGLPTHLNADFDLSASSSSPAAVAFGVLLAQPGISGSFHFTYDGPSMLIGGVLFNHGANLLSGSFDNAFISGVAGGAVASAQAEINTLGPITYTSDFLNFGPGDEGLSIALNSITPTLHIIASGDTLASFQTSATGNFSADVVTSENPAGGSDVPDAGSTIVLLFSSSAALIRLRRRRSESAI